MGIKVRYVFLAVIIFIFIIFILLCFPFVIRSCRQGSSTCEMTFDGSVGYLIGKENNGLHQMFTFMNTARIGRLTRLDLTLRWIHISQSISVFFIFVGP